MTNILTPEEKKYLRMISNYLQSIGMKNGIIEFEVEDGYFNPKDVRWGGITHFDNNYTAEIPFGLYPILKKILEYVYENDLIREIDIEDINYETINIDIDEKFKDITVSHIWSYYESGDVESTTFDSSEDKEQFQNWIDNELSTTEIPENGILTVKYDGGGDDGWVHGTFYETNESIPNNIQDWCVEKVSSNFPGWENNEGGSGEFIFDFNDKEITLNHTMNYDESKSDTIFEENFGK